MNTEELRIYLRTVADTTGFDQVQRELQQTQRSAASLTAAGAAAGVAATGVQALADRLSNLVNFFGDSITVAREHERVIRATSMAYGQAAKDFTAFASRLSAQTGFTSDAILQAALSARTLSQNYGLSIQQTQKLISVSADLARVRGIGIAEAFERVQSAIRGEAEASEYLGLTLNDTFLKNQAMNGSLKETYEKLTDVEKAQIRYNELLRQAGQFSGLATSANDSLDASFQRAAKSVNDLQQALGGLLSGPAIAGLNGLAGAADAVRVALEGKDPNAQRFRDFLGEFGKNVLGGGALVPSIQQAAERAEGRKITDEYIRQQEQLEHINRLMIAEASRQGEVRSATERQAAAEAARVALMDQAGAAVRDALELRQRQVDLERESVNLAAQEAQIRLSLLPAQERMAELQRQITEQQIRAQLAALPATEALEDLRYLQQRAQLISQNRNVAVEERIAARRQLRDIGRAAPGVELAALEAERGVALAGRAATRVGLEAQLFEISTQRQLAQIEQAQTTNQLLSQIAAQRTQAFEITINLTTEEMQKEVFRQLVEANQQAQGPTVIQLSGVRR